MICCMAHFEVYVCKCLLRNSIMTVIMLQLRECLAKLQGSCRLMAELMAAVGATPVYYTNLAHLIRNLVTKVTHTGSRTGMLLHYRKCMLQHFAAGCIGIARKRREILWLYCTCHAKTLSSLRGPVCAVNP